MGAAVRTVKPITPAAPEFGSGVDSQRTGPWISNGCRNGGAELGSAWPFLPAGSERAARLDRERRPPIAPPTILRERPGRAAPWMAESGIRLEFPDDSLRFGFHRPITSPASRVAAAAAGFPDARPHGPRVRRPGDGAGPRAPVDSWLAPGDRPIPKLNSNADSHPDEPRCSGPSRTWRDSGRKKAILGAEIFTRWRGAECGTARSVADDDSPGGGESEGGPVDENKWESHRRHPLAGSCRRRRPPRGFRSHPRSVPPADGMAGDAEEGDRENSRRLRRLDPPGGGRGDGASAKQRRRGLRQATATGPPPSNGDGASAKQ